MNGAEHASSLSDLGNVSSNTGSGMEDKSLFAESSMFEGVEATACFS